ncbi:MAG: hypothetical protein WBD07_08850 [Vicinamibacterales bacterium]
MRAKAIIFCFLALLTLPRPGAAQVPATLKFDAVFYGDNSEFFNRFRSGETILGWNQRLYWDIELSDRAALRLGVYALERLGSERSFDEGRPIVSLTLGTPRHRFILGTLDTGNRNAGTGPDRTTPHGLLPPLAVEPLWFTRAYEAGVQWKTDVPRLKHDLWFNYQQTNTPAHRELFDGGMVDRLHLRGPLSVGAQFHIVHHGGQQYASGPVADSLAYGAGAILEGPVARLQKATIEAYGLRAMDRPDRAVPALTVKGQGIFVRLAAETGPWRGHTIIWRASDFNHEDGDRNYLSRYADGTSFVSTRDYAETGLARVFKPAPSVEFETSFRLHRIESEFTYSYRLLATIHLTIWKFTI